jgi:lipoyl(octanoyl) transferase
MGEFTQYRRAQTVDEIWLVEHPPVFTLGQAGKREHILDRGAIPLVETDRGGQVTYHGPGQLVVYVLLDLRRLGIGARRLVSHLEAAVVALLAAYKVTAQSRPKAPGVYVGDKKVAALGLRIRQGCCFHGLSLNVDMDLEPFSRINPCGYAGLEVTQTRDLGISAGIDELGERLIGQMLGRLGYYAGQVNDTPPELS